MKSLVLFPLLALVQAFAQTGQTIQCNIARGNMPTLRHEGHNELVEAVLTCAGGTPTPAGQPVPLVDLTVSFNVPATSPTVIPNSAWVNAYLFIDNPAPANQIVQPVTASSGLSYNGPTIMGVGDNGLDYAGGAAPNVYYGRRDGASSITFTGIPFDPSPNGRTITIDPYNDAESLDSFSQDPKDILLIASLLASRPRSCQAPSSSQVRPEGSSTLGSQTTYMITPSPLDLGPVLDCFHYQANAGSAPANQPFNTSLFGPNFVLPPKPSATLNYSTLFSGGCLRTRFTDFQNSIGVTYNTDAGFTSAALPPVWANYGTQLQASFNNIPTGVGVFVQGSVTGPIGTIQLTSPGTPAGSTGLMQLPISKGSATAIWETQSADPTKTGTLPVPVYFAFQSGVPAPSQITVAQSLGSPPGGVSFYQPPPSLIQPIVFSINTGASTAPVMTAAVDSRLCIPGVMFRSGNACTPGNGLWVNVFSDSASVTENIPTFTPAGGLTNFALTPANTTPSFSQIFVNLANATPGVYHEVMNITSTAPAVKPLSVPFTVTVLPPDNPLFEVNGIKDAFTGLFVPIAPGQIFTLEGINFGPSTPVAGIVDSSGLQGTNLANTQVFFDGYASPLLHVSSNKLRGVVPFEIAGRTSTVVQMTYNGVTSPPVTVPVQGSSISIASDCGCGGILNQDGTLNTAFNPASVGDTVTIRVSYAGPFANGFTGTTGRTTIGPPYPAPAGPVSVAIGGVPVTDIQSIANEPGSLESIMLVSVTIPPGVQPDLSVPVVVAVGDATSVAWTTIAVSQQ
jgi:uncharacterized protein (TIGR03437 family)